jgi:hypothetical protein
MGFFHAGGMRGEPARHRSSGAASPHDARAACASAIIASCTVAARAAASMSVMLSLRASAPARTAFSIFASTTREAIHGGSATAWARSIAAAARGAPGMTVSKSRIQSRTTMAMQCEAQNRSASTLTSPFQPAMTIAAGILAPASYLRRRSPSWTKSEPPLTVRLASSASVVTTAVLTARRAHQNASDSASAAASLACGARAAAGLGSGDGPSR